MALIADKTRYHVVATADRESENAETSADFETAVSATGFGVFNVLLLLATIPAGWTTVFDTSTVAFIMPFAECDLDLTLFRKGALAAVPYAGMICTAFLWGFIADRVGRKYLLLVGLMLDALCNFFSSASPNFYVFLLFKFVNGIIVGGPFGILMTYIAEFHSESHRTRVLMWTGSLFALGNIAVPALARALLPLPWSFSLFNSLFVFDSWRIFLIICSLPPFLGFLAISACPESPKFLMSRGKSGDAVKIFRRMYTMNTGKSGDTYPTPGDITPSFGLAVPSCTAVYNPLCLNLTTCSMNKAVKERVSSDQQLSISGNSRLIGHNIPWIKVLLQENVATPRAPLESPSQSAPSLFAAPYLFPVFIINTILFASMTGMNMMKSWLPQLIVILNNFDPKVLNASISAPTICEKLDAEKIESFRFQTAQAIANATETCIPMEVSPTVYTNATIIAASAVLASLLTGIIVNKLGKKNILLLSLVAAGLCNFGIDWSPSTKVFLILASAIIALTGISTNTITAMTIEIVPTSLRATAVSLTVMTGRLGALTGNLLFSILLNVSCNAPFYYIGGFLILGFVLGIFLSKHSGKLR